MNKPETTPPTYFHHIRYGTVRGTSITVRVDAREAPARCLDVLTAAVRSCMLLEDDPAPSVARTEINGDGAVYDISFSVPSSAAIMPARTEILGQVQNHLRHAGISLAVAGQAEVPRTRVPSPAQMLEESDWFGVLLKEDRVLLAEHLSEVFVRSGETLIRKDEASEALFIIATGAVGFSNGPLAEQRPRYRMGPGGSLGAIGLITGAPYGITATAMTDVKVYRLDKEAIRSAIEHRPELITNLEALASHGQDLQRSDVAAPESDSIESSHMFLATLRGFLRKLSDPSSK